MSRLMSVAFTEQAVRDRTKRLYHVDVDGELLREGCGHMGATEFIETYFEPQGIHALDLVTRIEWRYLDGETS